MFTHISKHFSEERANEAAREKSVFSPLLKLASAKPHPLDTVAMLWETLYLDESHLKKNID